jgi:hypothetical protein
MTALEVGPGVHVPAFRRRRGARVGAGALQLPPTSASSASDPSAAHHDAGKTDVEPCAYIGTLLADGIRKRAILDKYAVVACWSVHRAPGRTNLDQPHWGCGVGRWLARTLIQCDSDSAQLGGR